MEYSVIDLFTYFLIYSFLGWVVLILISAVRDKKLHNCGFFGLPFRLSSGFTMILLILIYPRISDDLFLIKYLDALVLSAAVQFFAGTLARWVSGHHLWQYQEENLFSGDRISFFVGLIEGLLFMTGGLLVQPLLGFVIPLVPVPVKGVFCVILYAILLADLLLILQALRRKRTDTEVDALLNDEEKWTYNLEQKISSRIWRRLDKSYPDWDHTPREKLPAFAPGYGLYKMIWVFFAAALIGDLVETVFVGLHSGHWMNRSSLVFGPFSVVWGFGAVLLTALLHRLAQKRTIFVFLGGCVIGGAYEYTMSVFSEVFLHSTFWDYSNMPGNIGGRTNLLFCFFWGLLGLIWVKWCYPLMSRWIEKIPVIAGTVLTWVLLVAFVADAGLTVAVMSRYTQRQNDTKAANYVEEYLDENYPDQWVENRWPNMTVKN